MTVTPSGYQNSSLLLKLLNWFCPALRPNCMIEKLWWCLPTATLLSWIESLFTKSEKAGSGWCHTTDVQFPTDFWVKREIAKQTISQKIRSPTRTYQLVKHIILFVFLQYFKFHLIPHLPHLLVILWMECIGKLNQIAFNWIKKHETEKGQKLEATNTESKKRRRHYVFCKKPRIALVLFGLSHIPLGLLLVRRQQQQQQRKTEKTKNSSCAFWPVPHSAWLGPAAGAAWVEKEQQDEERQGKKQTSSLRQ